MRQIPPNEPQKSTEPMQDRRLGCWGLVILSIPAQLVANAWIDVYLQGYESWRDSLYCVPIYLSAGLLLAVILMLRELPSVRMHASSRPVCVFVIARMLTVGGLIILPIAIALAQRPQPAVSEIIYYVPLASAIIAGSSGAALMKMWRWTRVWTICCVIAIISAGGVVAREWYQMTDTTAADWFLLANGSRSWRWLLFSYLLLALPSGAAVIWCLSRRHVVDAFSRQRP